MKTTALLLGATFLVAIFCYGQPPLFEDLVTHGPKEGQTVQVLKTTPSPTEATVPQKESTIILNVGDQKTNMPVELNAFRHQYARVAEGKTSPPHNCYEFQIYAKAPHGFVWSCWTPDFGRPHRFRVLTTQSGQSYACYVREGVHLYELSQIRESGEIRRYFWENPFDDREHPDALPILPIELIQDHLGWTNTVGLGPQTWDVTVDRLSDIAGELQVTIHGTAPNPQCTFALRSGTWGWLSSTNDPTKAIDAEAENPPRKLVPVLGDLPIIQRWFGETNKYHDAPRTK